MGHGFHGFPIYGPLEMVVYGRGLWKGDFPIKPPSMSMEIHRVVSMGHGFHGLHGFHGHVQKSKGLVTKPEWNELIEWE